MRDIRSQKKYLHIALTRHHHHHHLVLSPSETDGKLVYLPTWYLTLGFWPASKDME